jgi:hypothetical protein
MNKLLRIAFGSTVLTAVAAAALWIVSWIGYVKPMTRDEERKLLRDQRNAADQIARDRAIEIDTRLRGWRVKIGNKTVCESPWIDGPNEEIICPSEEGLKK